MSSFLLILNKYLYFLCSLNIFDDIDDSTISLWHTEKISLSIWMNHQ